MLRSVIFCLLIFLPLAAQAETVIGLTAPLTGSYAAFGEQLKRGAEQAAQDLGGIKLRIADDACDPKQAVAVANQMASEGVRYVIGNFCSGATLAASKVYMENEIVVITLAANPRITDDAKTFMFRINGRSDEHGPVIARAMAARHAGREIALLNDKTSYGRGLADEVKKALNAAGVQEAVFESYNAGERDYRALVSGLKERGVKALFVGGYHAETALIARQMADSGMKAQIYSGPALMSREFLSIAGESGGKCAGAVRHRSARQSRRCGSGRALAGAGL